MSRWMVGCLVGLSFVAARAAYAARPLAGVVSQETAQRVGLERAWAAHVELNGGRGRIAHISVQAGLLMVQTDQALVQVLDAETRRTLWTADIGRPGSVTTAPTATEQYVASTNGGHLYLFDRASGRPLWQKKMPTVPSAGPAIGHNRVYVPLVTGMISSFRLPSPNRGETPAEQAFKDSALNYTGKGVAFAPPLVAKEVVLWGTDAGNVYAIDPQTMTAEYRVKTRGAVMARLTYRAPWVYAASRDGYVYAIKDAKGAIRWKTSIGSPIVERPMVTDDGVYVIPELGGLYKLSLDTGDVLWRVPGPLQFLSASPTRLYTADRAGRMLIFDARSGTRVGWLPTESLTLKVFNRENDRIYLATVDGLVQCLHESAQREPFWHVGELKDDGSAAEGEEPGDAEKPADATSPATDGANPFTDDAMTDDAGDDAAGGDEEQP